jgi:hypothetical protein
LARFQEPISLPDKDHAFIAGLNSLFRDSVMLSGIVNAQPIVQKAAMDFSISQNYPNPFNSGTVIYYSLRNKSYVEIVLYDALGSKVATLVSEEKEAGIYNFNFKSSSLPSGVYFYRFVAGGTAETKKMLLIR